MTDFLIEIFTKNNFSFFLCFHRSKQRKKFVMDDFGSHSVELYIYDMTQGMAAMMSPLLLGELFIYSLLSKLIFLFLQIT